MKTSGEPKHWDVSTHIKAIEQLIESDEVQMALRLIDMVPGYYRDNPLVDLIELKEKLYSQLWTVFDYMSDDDESAERIEKRSKMRPEELIEFHHFHPRAHVIKTLASELNSLGQTPKIFELAPAALWAPFGLANLGKKFQYKPISINKHTPSFYDQFLKKYPAHAMDKSDGPTIFCAFEVIEHLWEPNDIFHIYMREGIKADYVLLSTPKYTLYGGLDGWKTRDLGHLRTYTPHELIRFAGQHWPSFSWEYYEGDMMVIKGKRLGL